MRISGIVHKIKFLVLFSMLYGCHTYNKAPQYPSIKLPEGLSVDSSKTSIDKMQWRTFFTDTILISLIDEALKNNPDMLMATQRIELARSFLMQSRGSYLPYISADISASTNKLGEYTADGVGNFDSNLSSNVPDDKKIPSPLTDYFMGLRSSWEIDIWGKLRNLRRAAYARFVASEKGKHWVTTSLVAHVASLYYTLLAYDQELMIIQKNVELQKEILETIKNLKEAGKANELAIKQSTAQYMHTQFMEILIKQNIQKTENELNNLLGRYPQPIQRIDYDAQNPIAENFLKSIPPSLLLNRPDVQQAEWELKASEKELKAARAAFLPSLAISAHTGYNAFVIDPLLSPASFVYGALAGMSAPLLQGRRIKANHKAALARNYEAYYAYQKTILNAYKEVQTNLQKIEAYNKAMKLKEVEVQILTEGVVASDYLFKAGYASYLEVIFAQKNVLEAELQLVDTRKEKYLALVDLYYSLGGGWQ
ncbi:MAG: TolC family protein [Cytophagaceae bacterium]|nr:TolC family protein [Cytophagaceae bacterium]MDW8455208.1 TolC family protein [Cytophagaceae bacterium]